MDQARYEEMLRILLTNQDLSSMFESMMSETYIRTQIMNPTTLVTVLDGKMIVCVPNDDGGVLLKWKREDDSGSPVSDLKTLKLFIPTARGSKDYISNVVHICKNSHRIAITTDTQQHVIINMEIFKRIYALGDSELPSSSQCKIHEKYFYRLPRKIDDKVIKMISMEENMFYLVTTDGSIYESMSWERASDVEPPSPYDGKLPKLQETFSNDSLEHFHKCSEVTDPVYSISSGKNHTLCVTFNGSVLSRGSNKYGECGIANHKGMNKIIRDFTKIPNIPPASRACCGYNHSAILLHSRCKLPHEICNDGGYYDVLTFGSNSHGQLGCGSEPYNDVWPHLGTPLPVKLPGETIMISCYGNHTVCAIAKKTEELHDRDSPFLESELWGFGSNQYGQLGIPTISVIDNGDTDNDISKNCVRDATRGKVDNNQCNSCYLTPHKIEFNKTNHPLNISPNSVFCVKLLSTSETFTYSADNSDRKWIVGKDLFTSNAINLDSDSHILRETLYPITTPHNIPRISNIITKD